jgi:hypothetical protein
VFTDDRQIWRHKQAEETAPPESVSKFTLPNIFRTPSWRRNTSSSTTCKQRSSGKVIARHVAQTLSSNVPRVLARRLLACLAEVEDITNMIDLLQETRGRNGSGATSS